MMNDGVHDATRPRRPNLEQLKHQAKDLLRADPSLGKLAHAQRALARSYGLPSWPRLVLACRMTDAIWRDDGSRSRCASIGT